MVHTFLMSSVTLLTLLAFGLLKGDNFCQKSR